MKARDVMVSPVFTLKPTATVKEAAKLFLEYRISAAPVVDNQGKIIGIVSEGDLMRRVEAGTERRRSWWLQVFTDDNTLAADFVRSHAHKVADVMTRDVITASPDTSLSEIATLLESSAIKRVPIVINDQLVGIVTRANLIQALASDRKELDMPISDASIREKLLSQATAVGAYDASEL